MGVEVHLVHPVDMIPCLFRAPAREVGARRW